MNEIVTPEDYQILVEFAPMQQSGTRQVSLLHMASEEITEKSALAMQRALGAIKDMADKVTETIHKIHEPPTEVSVEFALKFDADANVYVAKASTEAGFKVSMTWKRKDKEKDE